MSAPTPPADRWPLVPGIDKIERGEIAAVWVDSGLEYCTTHHGVIDCDQNVCDFYDDEDGTGDCTPTPLIYLAGGRHESGAPLLQSAILEALENMTARVAAQSGFFDA